MHDKDPNSVEVTKFLFYRLLEFRKNMFQLKRKDDEISFLDGKMLSCALAN